MGWGPSRTFLLLFTENYLPNSVHYLGVRDVRIKLHSTFDMSSDSSQQEFLFYHQKDSDTSDDLLNPVTPWAQMMRLAINLSLNTAGLLTP